MFKNYASTLKGFNGNIKLLLLRTFIISLYVGIYGIIFNLYILELGYNTDFLGIVLAIHTLATSLAAVPSGILCDRLDRKKLMLASGLLSLVATIPLYLFKSPAILLTCSALTGAFVSIASVCVTPLLAENSCRKSSVHVFSANASLGWIATVFGCALGGMLPGIWRNLPVHGYSDYQLTMLVSSVLLVAGWMIMFLLKRGDQSLAVDGRSMSFSGLTGGIRISPDMIRFVITSGIFSIGSGMIVPYFNIYFLKVTHVGVFEIGIVSAVAGAFMVIGFMVIPLVTARIGKVRSAVVTKILSVPFLALMAVTTSFFAASTSYAIYMFFINIAGPATTSFQMEQVKPHEQGLTSGLITTGSYLAISVSTYISGLLIAKGNFTLPFLGTCVAYMLTAMLLYHYFKGVEKEHGGLRLSRVLNKAIA